MRQWWMVVVGALMGCSAMPPGTACAPGETRACPCPSGASGTQTCDSAGTGFSACGPCGNTCTPLCGGRVCGPDGCGGSCGICGAGTTCTAGQCLSSGPGMCSASNPSGACPTGQQCLNGACCAQPCGASCCNDGAVCVRDGAGNLSCAARCTSTSQCPGAAGMRCCRSLFDSTTNQPLSFGACGQFVAGETTCRCSTGADCGSGACTPATNPSAVPVGPYICTAPGCTPYGQCGGLGSCPNGYCNMCDAAGNCFCAQVCSSDAMCGTGQCVRLARSNGSCSATQTVCMPR